MSSPESNPYAPPKAELRDIVPAPEGYVRVGSLFVVKGGCEQNVPGDACVCCGEPAVETRLRTYAYRPRWIMWACFVGVIFAVNLSRLFHLTIFWRSVLLFAWCAGCVVAWSVPAKKARVAFGICGRHRRMRFALFTASCVSLVSGVIMVFRPLLMGEPASRIAFELLPLTVLLTVLLGGLAAGLLPRARHIDDRKSIFGGCGRKWLEQFPER